MSTIHTLWEVLFPIFRQKNEFDLRTEQVPKVEMLRREQRSSDLQCSVTATSLLFLARADAGISAGNLPFSPDFCLWTGQGQGNP